MKFRDRDAEDVERKALEGPSSDEEAGDVPAGLFDEMVPQTPAGLKLADPPEDPGEQ